MKKIIAIALTVIMMLALCACGAKDSGADSDLKYVQDKGTLIVGITDFAPMDYQDESGEWPRPLPRTSESRRSSLR